MEHRQKITLFAMIEDCEHEIPAELKVTIHEDGDDRVVSCFGRVVPAKSFEEAGSPATPTYGTKWFLIDLSEEAREKIHAQVQADVEARKIDEAYESMRDRDQSLT